MKPHHRIGLIYFVSFTGAAGVAYWRGRRASDLAIDTVLHGTMVGTGINVAAWLAFDVAPHAAKDNPC